LSPTFAVSTDLDEGMQTFLGFGTERLREEMALYFSAPNSGVPLLPRYAFEGDRDAGRVLVHGMKTAFTAAVQPYWADIRANHHSELAQHGRLLACRGVGAALTTVIPGASWRGDCLLVDSPHDRTVRLGGRGLLIAPAAFWTGPPLVGYGTDGYGPYGEGGYSTFHYIQLDIAPPERPNTRFSDDIKDFSLVLTVLDWIWREFVPGDKGFTDSLIAPLSGNYKSIEANGEAWTSVGKNFGLFASNLLDNASTLATKHWQGAAAKAFEQFLDLFWHDGAVWAGQKLGQFVADGFNKIADVSRRIAAFAIKAINDIIEAAGRIATKAIPVVGWAWTAVESMAKVLGDLFGIDVDDLYDDIKTIVNTAQKVVTLFDAMERLVEIMKSYFNTLEELVVTVKQIPDVGSLKDAVLTSRTIDEHLGTLDQQQTELEQQTGKADDALGKLEDIAANAEGG
jgi:hypothetical protein